MGLSDQNLEGKSIAYCQAPQIGLNSNLINIAIDKILTGQIVYSSVHSLFTQNRVLFFNVILFQITNSISTFKI